MTTFHFVLSRMFNSEQVIQDSYSIIARISAGLLSPPIAMLTAATQGEVLRAVQKDASFTDSLQRSVGSLCLDLLGPRVWLRYKWACEPVCRLLYYLVTTGSELQTLGEEYTGIIQVRAGAKRIPTRAARMLMIFLQTFGPHVCKFLLKKIQHWFQQEGERRGSSTNKIDRIFTNLDYLLGYLDKLNICLFYFQGTFYHLSKRLTGIRYVRYSGHNQMEDTTTPSFKLLGVVTSVQLLLSLLNRFYNKPEPYEDPDRDEDPDSDEARSYVPPHKRCILCLGRLGSMGGLSAGECGHLFCWSCIQTSLRSSPQCPLCRHRLNPSNIVPCRNYSKLS